MDNTNSGASSLFYLSYFERIVVAAEQQSLDLSGIIRLMLGFFVTQLVRVWHLQFKVLKLMKDLETKGGNSKIT